MSTTTTTSDKAQIEVHIRGLFEAYMRGDRESIRRGHTADWKGFPVRARQMIRGLDAYMVEADKILATMRSVGYRFLDLDIEVLGDVAIVYYLAECTLEEAATGTRRVVQLRSVDVYRREPEGWNQCGSNICVVPEQPPGEALSESDRAALLACRERVWRSWFVGDAAALRELLPEDAIAIDPGVELWADREAIIERSHTFVGEGHRLVSLEFPQTEFQSFGNAVVIYTSYRFVTEQEGVRTTREGRGTEVFVRRDGRWINAGWHLDPG